MTYSYPWRSPTRHLVHLVPHVHAGDSPVHAVDTLTRVKDKTFYEPVTLAKFFLDRVLPQGGQGARLINADRRAIPAE